MLQLCTCRFCNLNIWHASESQLTEPVQNSMTCTCCTCRNRSLFLPEERILRQCPPSPKTRTVTIHTAPGGIPRLKPEPPSPCRHAGGVDIQNDTEFRAFVTESDGYERDCDVGVNQDRTSSTKSGFELQERSSREMHGLDGFKMTIDTQREPVDWQSLMHFGGYQTDILGHRFQAVFRCRMSIME